jgi:CheY-like chemotaxis protein
MTDTPAIILVVDDDPFTAELTAMIIEMAGYETVIAEGGGTPWRRSMVTRPYGWWSRI